MMVHSRSSALLLLTCCLLRQTACIEADNRFGWLLGSDGEDQYYDEEEDPSSPTNSNGDTGMEVDRSLGSVFDKGKSKNRVRPPEK